MYKLPQNINFEFLKGREICQICFGILQVQFNFDASVKIYVTSPFSYVSKEGVESKFESSKMAGGLVDKLIGKGVIDVSVQEESTLVLIFSTGEKLVFYGDNSGYECYEIRHGNHVIVV
jgi:hypothetical protein